jgi:hypothetical protein
VSKIGQEKRGGLGNPRKRKSYEEQVKAFENLLAQSNKTFLV